MRLNTPVFSMARENGAWYRLLPWSFLLCLANSALTGAGTVAADKKPASSCNCFDNPAYGCILDGKVYCLRVKKRIGPGLEYIGLPHELWIAELTRDGEPKRQKKLVDSEIWGDSLPRWRISQGCVWVSGYPTHGSATFDRIPLERLGKPSADCRLLNIWGLQPVSDLAWRHVEKGGLDPVFATKNGYYDLVPQGADGLVVLLAWRKEIRVWSGENFKEAKDKPCQKLRWVNDGRIAKPGLEIKLNDEPLIQPIMRVRTEISEPFRAFQDKTHFFFATSSGKLHACIRENAKKTGLVWDEPKRPIRMLFTDNTTQKTYAFTTPTDPANKHTPAVYFELAPKAEPIPYDIKSIPKPKEDDPMATMMAYARILLREKKVSVEK